MELFPSLGLVLILAASGLSLQGCGYTPASAFADRSVAAIQPSPTSLQLPPPVAPGIVYDRWGRVSATNDKKEVPCPKQDTRTAVILTIGQSNAANYATRAYRSRHGRAVLNWFDGQCYLARSPLLGADGPWGEYWTELGNRLVDAHQIDHVILVSSAIGGSNIAQWKKEDIGARHGNPNLNAMLMDAIAKVQTRYAITHILWHQGESDSATSKNDYIRSFLSLVSSLRERGVTAPVYVSVTSAEPRKNLPVVEAQRALPTMGENIRAGVDTDALVKPEDRNETGHFGPMAQEKVIRAWMKILAPESE